MVLHAPPNSHPTCTSQLGARCLTCGSPGYSTLCPESPLHKALRPDTAHTLSNESILDGRSDQMHSVPVRVKEGQLTGQSSELLQARYAELCMWVGCIRNVVIRDLLSVATPHATTGLPQVVMIPHPLPQPLPTPLGC